MVRAAETLGNESHYTQHSHNLDYIGIMGVALLEYCFMVPANRYGFTQNGGQFSLIQLKVMQEVISLLVFSVFAIVLFKGESLHWNHLLAFGLSWRQSILFLWNNPKTL